MTFTTTDSYAPWLRAMSYVAILIQIFQHFNETLQGLITIRAFNATERFQIKNMTNVDYHMRAEMGQNVASRWLTIRMQFLGALSLFLTTFGICLCVPFVCPCFCA
jgi:ABC-type transport system involved in cytochrome bd biosynthesis fused ATPase/permease subunit